MGTMLISSGTEIGPYHVARELPNQDAFESHESGELTLITVADGAGSLERSDEGARIAVSTVKRMLESVDEVSAATAAELVNLAREAVVAENDPELGCTLALVLTNGSDWAAAGVGDSFAVIETNREELQLFTSPPNEYANVTQLLTSRSPSVWSGEGTEFSSAAVCSDGMEHLTIQGGKPFERFWLPYFADLREGRDVADLLEHLAVSERLEDDTTAVCAVLAD